MADIRAPFLEHGKSYKVATKEGTFIATVEGPVTDGASEFYIVCGPSGDFDIEFTSKGMWDAGEVIGLVRIQEV